VTNDAYQEGDETFSLTLSGASGAELLSPASSTATIQDNDFSPPQSNPVDGSSFFVRQHYRDFLNRNADTPGLQFWFNQIEGCGADTQCREVKRINVSAAFFLSIEFQETGYLVYRLNQTSFATGETLGMGAFLKDTQEIGQGVIVGAPDWEQKLEMNTRDYLARFVARPEFVAAYPASLSAAQFVDALNANTKDPEQPSSGGSLTPAQRDQLVADLTAGTKTRAAGGGREPRLRPAAVEPRIRLHAVHRLPAAQPERPAGFELRGVQLLAPEAQRFPRKFR
jgi:hypothetical protein